MATFWILCCLGGVPVNIVIRPEHYSRCGLMKSWYIRDSQWPWFGYHSDMSTLHPEILPIGFLVLLLRGGLRKGGQRGMKVPFFLCNCMLWIFTIEMQDFTFNFLFFILAHENNFESWVVFHLLYSPSSASWLPCSGRNEWHVRGEVFEQSIWIAYVHFVFIPQASWKSVPMRNTCNDNKCTSSLSNFIPNTSYTFSL